MWLEYIPIAPIRLLFVNSFLMVTYHTLGKRPLGINKLIEAGMID